MSRMLNLLVVIAAVAVLCSAVADAADAPVVPGTEKNEVAEKTAVQSVNLTQREFAEKLIQNLELGSLPKKVKDKHLLDVLSGRRTLVVEAEEHYDKRRDRVTVRPYNAIGAFSGKGWLSGTAESTSVTFKARIPLAGVYRMTVKGAGDGQLWSVAGRAFKINCGPQLQEVEVGTVILDAELLSFNVILPPNGAIDVITFTASDLPPLQPTAGWQFDAPLTYGAAAEVGALLLVKSLPFADDPALPQRLLPVAGNAALPSGASLVTDLIYGKFMSESWLRNGYTPSKIEIPFQIDATSFYQVKIHWLGEKLRGTLDGVEIEGQGKRYFDWVELGILFLPKGKHRLQLELPAMAGADTIAFTAKASGEKACLAMLGWTQQPAQVVPASELERLVKDLADRYRSSRQP